MNVKKVRENKKYMRRGASDWTTGVCWRRQENRHN